SATSDHCSIFLLVTSNHRRVSLHTLRRLCTAASPHADGDGGSAGGVPATAALLRPAGPERAEESTTSLTARSAAADSRASPSYAHGRYLLTEQARRQAFGVTADIR